MDPVCVIKVPGLDSSSHPSVVLLTVGRRAPQFVTFYLHWEHELGGEDQLAKIKVESFSLSFPFA